jgi:molybdopterin molybdotransferase
MASNATMGADPDDTTQRIARLTPLDAVLARIDALVAPVLPREIGIAHALGRVLAEDVIVPMRPARALALRDGWAVRSELTTDASSYAPADLPAASRIDAGDELPPGADAVAPFDILEMRDGRAEIIAQVAPGDGVLAAGADALPSAAFLPAGLSLSPVRLAVLAAAGISRAHVREPRVRLVNVRPRDPVVTGAAGVVAHAISAGGGAALADDIPLEDALRDEETDALVAIGGTGSGRNDASVRTLARLDRVEVHGIALTPGETAAFGFAGPRPVLLLPGRLDAALAVWLLLGRRLLGRLCGGFEQPSAVPARLTRKVASTLGLAELIPVRLRGRDAEPLASGHWPLQLLARSDGWFLVAADHEGHPAGAEVMIRPWP